MGKDRAEQELHRLPFIWVDLKQLRVWFDCVAAVGCFPMPDVEWKTCARR